MQLDNFNTGDFTRGRPRWIEALWGLVQMLFIRSSLPGSAYRCFLLRLFGAQIGSGVVIKPGVRVKFPWRLQVGDHSWVGEDAWIDNLAPVTIGSHCCISQGAYLCTGSHDWGAKHFDLIVKPIVLHNQVWLGARTSVGPGVTIGEGAVLTLGGVAVRDLSAWQIHQGLPASPIKPRHGAAG